MADPMQGRWADLDQAPEASAQMIQWHAPKTWDVMCSTVRLADACKVTWEYGQLYRDGVIYPYSPNYPGWPITHRRRIRGDWQPLPAEERAS